MEEVAKIKAIAAPGWEEDNVNTAFVNELLYAAIDVGIKLAQEFKLTAPSE
jgi:hypothetical protein